MPPLVGHPAHQPVERVDLAHQMALAEPTDRRIARHRADGREPVRDQRGSRAHARGRGRGLAAGVPAANDDDIEGHDVAILPEWLIFNKLFWTPRKSKRIRIKSETHGVSRETCARRANRYAPGFKKSSPFLPRKSVTFRCRNRERSRPERPPHRPGRSAARAPAHPPEVPRRPVPPDPSLHHRTPKRIGRLAESGAVTLARHQGRFAGEKNSQAKCVNSSRPARPGRTRLAQKIKGWM